MRARGDVADAVRPSTRELDVDRGDDRDVGEVRSAERGVVRDGDVSFRERKVACHLPHAHPHRAEVDRHVRRVRHEASLRVGECAITLVNELLADAPETVNQDPMGAGWFIRVVPDSDDVLSGLLTAEAYAALVGE